MFPVVTFSDIVTQVANSMGLGYSLVDTPPIDDMSKTTKSKIAGFSNTALDRVWRNPNPAFAWKWTTTSATINLQTNGSILWSDIQYSDDWFSLFTFDPRPMDNPPPNLGWYVGNSALPVRCVEDASAIWPRLTQTSVFAFWRLPVPKLTSRVVDAMTTYNTIGTLVWDETGTGSVYKSIATGALGSNLLDAAKWVVQDIPYRLSNVLAEMAQTMMLQASGADGSSTVNNAEAMTWLDIEMAKENPRDGSGPVWSYDRRYVQYCSGFNWTP